MYEARRAARAARGFTDAWLGDVLDAQAAGQRYPYAWASRKRASRLALGAATESAEAFNLERDRALASVADQAGTMLVKVWDASLDKRTCPRCERLHGSWVPLGEQFPDGPPGGLHPRCRCAEQIEPMDWVTADQYAYAA